jgi:ribosome biogenesis GTPase / thiamine phosphate phosphatase
VDGAAPVNRRRFDVDDHGQFDRPRRHTRPRTKERPAYPEAVSAVVVAVDRGRYTCLLDDQPADRVVLAMKSRPLGRRAVVVGDRVALVGDVGGADGSLARIVEVSARATVLRRTADDTDPVERVVVANADQLVVVAALADPPPRSGLIDRCLVAAYDAGLDPLLCLTKPDLADPETLLAIYRPLEVPYVVTERGSDRCQLKERLRDRVSVLVGHSGVGKSTLVNDLVPGAERTIGRVNAVTGRGRHTSTSVIALRLPFGGWVIDTPGIRSFGLAHVDPRRLIGAFPDLAELTGDCPRGCTHAATEPECALDEAVAAGRVEPARVESYRRLLASRESAAGDVSR